MIAAIASVRRRRAATETISSLTLIPRQVVEAQAVAGVAEA